MPRPTNRTHAIAAAGLILTAGTVAACSSTSLAHPHASPTHFPIRSVSDGIALMKAATPSLDCLVGQANDDGVRFKPGVAVSVLRCGGDGTGSDQVGMYIGPVGQRPIVSKNSAAVLVGDNFAVTFAIAYNNLEGLGVLCTLQQSLGPPDLKIEVSGKDDPSACSSGQTS